MRLDNVIYRAGFALTRAQARQMVNHRVFELNGKRADVASMQVKSSDIITVRDKFKSHPVLTEMESEKTFPPKWMHSDIIKREIKILSIPEDEQMEQSIALHMIVEFYSR
jgi:small subunit ribosomal protein S4